MFKVRYPYPTTGSYSRLNKTGRYGITFPRTYTFDVADTLDDARKKALKVLIEYNKRHYNTDPVSFSIIERGSHNATVTAEQLNGRTVGCYRYLREMSYFDPKTGKILKK